MSVVDRPLLVRSDAEVMDRARHATYGRKFEQLWAGEWKRLGYKSQSNADMALCGYLAYWGCDPDQVDRLFRQSGLMRSTWDEKHFDDGRTYGKATIAKAMMNNAGLR